MRDEAAREKPDEQHCEKGIGHPLFIRVVDIFSPQLQQPRADEKLQQQLPGVEAGRHESGRHAEQNPADDVINRRRADAHPTDGDAFQFYFQKNPAHDRQRGNGQHDAKKQFKAEARRARRKFFVKSRRDGEAAQKRRGDAENGNRRDRF